MRVAIVVVMVMLIVVVVVVTEVVISNCTAHHTSTYTTGKEGNVLFNDALNTFYLRLYGVGHIVKDHSDSERGNPLPPYGLIFPISSKGSFISFITPDVGYSCIKIK